MDKEGEKAFNNKGSQETPLEIARKNFHNALGMLGERLGLSGEELEVFVRDAHTGMVEAAGIQTSADSIGNLIQRSAKDMSQQPWPGLDAPAKQRDPVK